MGDSSYEDPAVRAAVKEAAAKVAPMSMFGMFLRENGFQESVDGVWKRENLVSVGLAKLELRPLDRENQVDMALMVGYAAGRRHDLVSFDGNWWVHLSVGDKPIAMIQDEDGVMSSVVAFLKG